MTGNTKVLGLKNRLPAGNINILKIRDTTKFRSNTSKSHYLYFREIFRLSTSFNVNFQLGDVEKGLVTVFAGKWLLILMLSFHVGPQSHGVFVIITAEVTFDTFSRISMDWRNMALQLGLISASVRAFLTLVGSGAYLNLEWLQICPFYSTVL